MTNTPAADQDAIETVRKLIKGIDIAMLTSVAEQGLVSRPMKTQEVEFDGDLWFLTMKDTEKYDELIHNPNVNVTYVGKSYVSIRGTAELVDSREKIKEFWNAAYEKMLETTSDDPNLILIKVKAETAEYWEMGNRTKLVKELYKKLTGKKSDDSRLNEIVDLSHAGQN
ncbi:general stress protein [Xylanibacillus composti]|uniref:General stress protein n=1 Tax=Xylanibacillus composti TaxID=1572762 RepID=A0A8J4H3U5_9BACL|nr:pyridoxamine 5'-phosphate oxidase family protein [Xylanibacillus composti]MDT9725299.1 general stress protein [Xylanibacillus composti]GIQ70502.1 general stress protein [Xylanibacillus composti]